MIDDLTTLFVSLALASYCAAGAALSRNLDIVVVWFFRVGMIVGLIVAILTVTDMATVPGDYVPSGVKDE